MWRTIRPASAARTANRRLRNTSLVCQMHYSRSKSRIGFSKGWSLAFLRASSNLRLRTSSFLLSASQESRNLSSRLRACSARMRAASLISTSGAALGGATYESTTESSGSTVSFDWQHGQVTSIGGADFFAMQLFYDRNGLHERGIPIRAAAYFHVAEIHVSPLTGFSIPPRRVFPQLPLWATL